MVSHYSFFKLELNILLLFYIIQLTYTDQNIPISNFVSVVLCLKLILTDQLFYLNLHVKFSLCHFNGFCVFCLGLFESFASEFEASSRSSSYSIFSLKLLLDIFNYKKKVTFNNHLIIHFYNMKII